MFDRGSGTEGHVQSQLIGDDIERVVCPSIRLLALSPSHLRGPHFLSDISCYAPKEVALMGKLYKVLMYVHLSVCPHPSPHTGTSQAETNVA